MTGRRFILLRVEDVSGMSGTGPVADGCLFPNGRVALTWRTEPHAMTFHLGIEELEALHSHEGRTRLHWIDKEDTMPHVQVSSADMEATFGEYLTGTDAAPEVDPAEKALFDTGITVIVGHPEGLVGKRRQPDAFLNLVRAYGQIAMGKSTELVAKVTSGEECRLWIKPGRSAWEFHRKASALGFAVRPGRPRLPEGDDDA